jgi:hypothetical protein
MKLKLVTVELEIPAEVKRLALRAGVALAILFGGGAVAWAAGLVTWSSGQTLTASDLNNNFSYVQAHPILMVADGGSYSLSAIFCGQTLPNNTGDLGGYASASQVCQTKCGPAAHMCTTEEMVRSAQLGISVPNAGWYASGVQLTGSAGNPVPTTDCQGFTSDSADYYGAVWDGFGQISACNNPEPIDCCS